MNIEKIFKLSPFNLDKKARAKLFKNRIEFLTRFHYQNCLIYKGILKNLNFKFSKKTNLDSYPMLPVRVFKNFELISVIKKKIVKKLVSSGTSGERSQIYLDKINAKNQVRVLKNIVATILGEERLPMLIIDQNPKILNRSTFSAKIAAIYGFSIFGKDHNFLINEKGKIDYKKLNIFLKKYSEKNFFIFGFTSQIYSFLIKELKTELIKKDFKNGILLHGGGWKKMEDLKINNKSFKSKLLKKINLKKIYNYYGLVEQTGSIFVDCNKCGNFITSAYSDVLVRDEKFNLAKKGESGLIQLLSLIPSSYPGHNILTEDIGEIVDEDHSHCGMKGKSFKVHGRAKEAEVRGCSDVR